MLATIVLPPGTERVTLRDIPDLFANAIHPPLPEGTPRVLSYLQKEALTKELADNWCGFGNNFPINITAIELEALNTSVWAGLPRLELQPENNEGPTKLKTMVTEPGWEPYRLAFEGSPPEDWRLIAVWRNTVLEQWLMSHEAQNQWKQLLEQHAARGDIAPRSPTSYIPTTGVFGRQLQESFLTVPEFAEFAAKYSVAVKVQREFTRKPVAAPLLDAIREVPPDESIVVHETIGGYNGQGVAPARDWLERLKEVVKRQEQGYFTVGEAAQMLADANPSVDAKDLIERMASACVGNVQTRRRLIRGADLMPLVDGKEFREFMDLVHVEEVDEWLSRSMGVPYRLGPLVPALSVFPGGKHLPTDVHYTIPLHPPLEPRGPWKGGRMADDDVLSLVEAARQASRHAGQEVTEHDFLRAAARGEIRIRAIMHKAATMLPVRAAEGPITLQPGRFQELSPETCELLSITGKAGWRGVEAFEPVEAFDGRVCRFTCWRLPVGEPDILTNISDCIVMGADVHALADAFRDSDVAPDEATATDAPASDAAAFDIRLHASRDQLIEAFGSFTGMNKDWFTNLKDTPALFKARKSPGQGGRGHIMEPFFCPFEVMQWLVSPKRKKGRPMSEPKGWEMLERFFPRVYAQYAAADPRE
jgi:hypothetical protein